MYYFILSVGHLFVERIGLEPVTVSKGFRWANSWEVLLDQAWKTHIQDMRGVYGPHGDN